MKTINDSDTAPPQLTVPTASLVGQLKTRNGTKAVVTTRQEVVPETFSEFRNIGISKEPTFRVKFKEKNTTLTNDNGTVKSPAGRTDPHPSQNPG